MANLSWLQENANLPIRHILSRGSTNIESLLHNSEVASWYSRLTERSQTGNITAIHGSHDYRMENILGKCWILGLKKQIDPFAENITFILNHLNHHIQLNPAKELTFDKLYHYRDYEKVLCCFLPFLGFYDDPAVAYVVKQRIDILYAFTRQKRYDIYINGSRLKGVKKEWQPYIIDPDLYADGHIALPDIHDLLLFAGMYPTLGNPDREKVECIAAWFFGEGYHDIFGRYGYFYIPSGSYSTKAVISKLQLIDFMKTESDTISKSDVASLLFNTFLLSHFRSARESKWFSCACQYLEQYKCESGRYRFPPHMITEKPDSYVITGGHMNVGENKRNKQYHEILSTYWMERIDQNVHFPSA